MEETKIDVQDFDTFDIPSYSPAYEDGTIGDIQPDETANPDGSTDTTKMKEETHKGSDPSKSWLPFLSVEYYQSYFDVTTSDVFHRVMAGVSPYPYKLSNVISTSPDLYGPFWLCMTLIFTTAISGNLSALFSGDDHWEFHFHEVIVIATVVYVYTWLLPIVLWFFLMWRNSSERYSLIKLQSVYGYSMATFIPLTLMWIINVESLRWLVLGVSVALSGAVLVQALWTPLQNETKRIAVGIVCIVFILHSGVGTGFKLYYFSSSLAPNNAPLVSTPTPIKPTQPSILPIITNTEATHLLSTTVPTDDDVTKRAGHHDVLEGTPSVAPNTESTTEDKSTIPHNEPPPNPKEGVAKGTITDIPQEANQQTELPIKPQSLPQRQQ